MDWSINIKNPELINLIRSLRKKSNESGAEIWREVADRLSCSRQRRTTVNISRLNRYTENGEIVVVPGKVLGSGKIDHPIHVAAFSFSKGARLKISGAKGNCMSILELTKKNPEGRGIKIVG